MQLQVFTIKIPKTIFFFIFQEKVAFFAYMNWDQETPSRRHILIFDVVRTNLGDHFKFSGIFNAPQSRTYVFTWEGYCFVKGYTSFQIVVNANVYIGLHCSAGRGGGEGLFIIDLFRGMWGQKQIKEMWYSFEHIQLVQMEGMSLAAFIIEQHLQDGPFFKIAFSAFQN